MTVALTPTQVLETERLILRTPGPEDVHQWIPFAGSERAQYIGGPMDTAAAWRSFGHAIGHWVMRGYGSFAITLRGEDIAIGMTGPWFPINWPEREIGWTLWDAAYEGRGIAAEAAAAARAHAFDTLGWDTAVSYIHPENVRSAALAERLGARLDPEAPGPYPGDLVYRHMPRARAKAAAR